MKLGDISNLIISKLNETQLKSNSPTEFEEAIRDAFDFLGFEAELIGGSGDTDVLLTANIGKESYKISVDGKTSSSGKINDSQIDWLSLRDHKQKNHTNFVVVVGPSFSGGNLEKRAIEHDVSLLKTDELVNLVKAHSIFPFTLMELKSLFRGNGNCSSQIDDLLIQNRFQQKFLEQFRTIIEQMQSLQDGKLGYFNYAILAGREKIVNEDIDIEDIKSAINLLELPFIRAIEPVSAEKSDEYILTMGFKDLSNIFSKISSTIDEDKIQINVETKSEEDISKLSVKETVYGSKYYEWYIKGDSVIANAREENPYTHHCPINHFIAILNAIIEIFKIKNQNLINQDIIYSVFDGKELTPGRPFKGKAESYKIYMALGILEIEGLIKWTGSKRPIEYTLSSSLDSLKNWMETTIVRKNN